MERSEDKPLWYYIAISIALHLIVYLLFHFTLPHFKKELKEEVMTFEVVPVQDTSNIKTQKNQNQKEKKEVKAKKRAKSKKTNPKQEPKQAPKKPEPKPKEDKKPAKKPDPKKVAQPKKKAPEKPKPKPKPNPKVNEMEQLLKNLEKESQGREEKSRKQAVEKEKNEIDDAIGRYKENSPMSIAEENYIRSKVAENWNIPIGVRNAGEITVNLHINLNTDGTLSDVSFGGVTCPPGSEIACRAAVDSAIRAVRQASPFDQLRADRYATWAEFKFNFNPKDASQ